MGWVWRLLGGFGLLVLLAMACTTGFALGAVSAQDGLALGRGDAVAVIRVSGTLLTGDGEGGLLGPQVTSSDWVIQMLRRAQRNAVIKAIVLRVDSPGGSVTASDEIYNEIVKTREQHRKPVVASMGGLAASGGYYISAAAEKIVANPTSLTGSIGVISIVPNMEGLLEKLGIEAQVFTSGAHKDETSGLRRLTDEEKALWQGLIDDTYERFVEVVAQGRAMERAQVRKLADGRIYTGRQAKELGLIDEFGDMAEAVELAARLGGIPGQPRTIEMRREGLLTSLLGTMTRPLRPVGVEELLSLGRPVTLFYLFLGP